MFWIHNSGHFFCQDVSFYPILQFPTIFRAKKEVLGFRLMDGNMPWWGSWVWIPWVVSGQCCLTRGPEFVHGIFITFTSCIHLVARESRILQVKQRIFWIEKKHKLTWQSHVGSAFFKSPLTPSNGSNWETLDISRLTQIDERMELVAISLAKAGTLHPK